MKEVKYESFEFLVLNAYACVENEIIVCVLVFFFFDKQEYEIFEKLGEGGFAKVHRARCKKSGFEVALKMVCCDIDMRRAV